MCNAHSCIQVEMYLNNKYWMLQFGNALYYTPNVWRRFSIMLAIICCVCAGEQGQRHSAPLSQRLKRAFGIPATVINTIQETDWAVAFTGPFSETKLS